MSVRSQHYKNITKNVTYINVKKKCEMFCCNKFMEINNNIVMSMVLSNNTICEKYENNEKYGK